jgi:tetratricopeptide (TPR) repeat protein
MKVMKHIKAMVSTSLVLMVLLHQSSCKKFLEAKPDDKLVVVSTVQDMQSLLDNYQKMNFSDQHVSETCSDNNYITDAVFNARKESERNLYTWTGTSVFEPQNNSWADTYNVIYIANLVIQRATALEDKIPDKSSLASVRAQAYFHRGREFLQAASVWAPDYNASTASGVLGIPLPKEPDFNIPSTRSTLADTYAQIVSDLREALKSLPAQVINPLRPSKAACYGMLARTYLYMDDFQQAEAYADSCLRMKLSLMDFNTLNPASSFPIAQFNPEVVFESKLASGSLIVQSRSYINPTLYALYAESDLRKTIFYKMGSLDYVFKGNYAGEASFFNGIAVDEMLLIRSESEARNGKVSMAMDDLNLLRKNRIKSAAYVPLQAGSAAEALTMIKKERRMELPYRGLRWMDIKRWNSEGDNIILMRTLNKMQYILPPNDPRYAIAIPEDVIALSGMMQNPR